LAPPQLLALNGSDLHAPQHEQRPQPSRAYSALGSDAALAAG